MSELSSRSLTQALSEFVPRHWDNSSRRGSAEYIYPEEEIDQVSNILSVLDEEHRRWTHVPRLYIVLRRVGLTDFLNNFLQAGLNDYCFPFSESGLRHVLQSHHADAFLRVQSCVLSRHFQLERFKKNEHVYFATEEEIPFRQVGWLGSGGFSEVQKVVSTVDFKTYARKMIKRASLEGKIRHGWSDFERELNTLKKVKHYHTVQLVGSYTDPRFAAFIMSPVADCSLDQFMSFHTINDEKLSLIQGFFGCLMAALSYLHDQNIRHKDIKPKNILIKGGKALFTDFGLSLDCTDLTRSTTEGPTARTLRYCAPEVASSSPRNKSSDVWSLGCVFLEMMTMLKEKSVEDLRTFLEENGMESSLFWDNQPGVAQWIMLLRETPRGEMDNTPLIWIERMLSWDRMARPTGESLLAHIVPYGAASGQPGKFCGACCRFEYDITAPPVLSDGTMRQSREPPVGEGVVIRSVEVSVAPKLELSDITMRPSTSLSIPSLVLSNLDSTSQSMMDISIPESPTMKEPSISAPGECNRDA
jgi:serine/threonine protein kinase